MATQQPIGKTLATPVATLSPAQAQLLALDRYGLRVVARSLASERDQNFHLQADDRAEYVLKLSNPAEDRRVTHLQTRVLIHIAETDPDLPVPRLFRSREGATESLLTLPDGGVSVLRLFSYLQGQPLRLARRSPLQRETLGRLLARLDLALRSVSHPRVAHEIGWDIGRASELRGLFTCLSRVVGRRLVEQAIENFERHALPHLPHLRAQLIHNDLNPDNVLVGARNHARVAGILDFGDMVHAPLVNDLAVAAAYQLSAGANPLDAAAELVAAYCVLVPLEPLEIELLFDLIAARLAMTVTIGAWRARQFPSNRAYILRNNRFAWSALEGLAALGRDAGRRLLHKAATTQSRT